MKKNLVVAACVTNWGKVYRELYEFMINVNIPKTFVNHMLIAIEEIFVNISKYAYLDSIGDATIECEYIPEYKVFKIRFIDSGIPFDPTKIKHPDITQDANKRKIGGLGIFMVGKIMDSMEYKHKEGKNNLTVTKKIK